MDLAEGTAADVKRIGQEIVYSKKLLHKLPEILGLGSARDLPAFFEVEEVLKERILLLTAAEDYIDQQAGSRGAFLYPAGKGTIPLPGLDEKYRISVDTSSHAGQKQILSVEGDTIRITWENTAPMPSHIRKKA